MTERAGIYARSATDNPDSIDNQRAGLRAHAEAHGYEVTEDGADNDVSGNVSPFERQGLGALLTNPDGWDTLVTYSLDRVSRDFDDINRLEGWLRSNGKALETVTAGLVFPRLTPNGPQDPSGGAVTEPGGSCCPCPSPHTACA